MKIDENSELFKRWTSCINKSKLVAKKGNKEERKDCIYSL